MIILRRTFKNSLQQKIFCFTLLIVFIPLVGIGGFSYVQSKDIIIENHKNANKHIIEQVGTNIEFALDDVHDLSLFFIQSKQARSLLSSSQSVDTLTYKQNKRNVEELLMHLIGTKDYIKYIQIENEKEVLVNTESHAMSTSMHVQKKLDDLNGAPLILTKPEPSTIAYARLIKNVNNVTESFGYITIDLNIEYLNQLFRNKFADDQDSYFLVNEQDEAFVSEKLDSFNDNELDYMFKTTKNKNEAKITIDGKDYINMNYDLDGTPLRIVNIVSLDELMSENKFIPIIIMISLIISLFICTIAAYQFSKYVVRPINQLQSLMKTVEDGDLDVKYSSNSNNEIDMLGKSFNSMIKKLKFLIEMVYIAQLRSKEAELKALYTQINPHFLYNTLDGIYWMGQVEKAPKSAKMIHALSKLFRMMLKDQEEVTLVENEMEYVHYYLEIQRMRYDDTILFYINVQPETTHTKTIKMILQPLVENAITHGLQSRDNGGEIYIQTVLQNECLEITVEDNGGGASISYLNQLIVGSSSEEEGIALKNIHDRIRIHSGEGYGLSFSESVHGGLKVIARQKWEEA